MSTNAKQGPTGASLAKMGSTSTTSTTSTASTTSTTSTASTASISETLKRAKHIQEAFQSFASNDGYLSLSYLADRIPELEKIIQERDDTIKALKMKLENEEKSHLAGDQKRLRTFMKESETWKDEKSELNKNIQELQRTIQAKDAMLKKSTAELGEVKTRRSELEKDFAENAKRLKQSEEKARNLEEQLQSTRAEVASGLESLKMSRDRVVTLEKSLKAATTELERTKEESAKRKDKLTQLINCSVPLTKLDIEQRAGDINRFWEDAATLVREFFRQDLPETVLLNDWGTLRKTVSTFGIPLPQSNSNVAKEMRIVAVLGVLARLVDRYILQPTWLLHENSGFREHSRRQAPLDPKKERFARGIILSMSKDRQEKIFEERVDAVIGDLIDDSGISALLAPGTASILEDGLEEFLEKVKACWKIIQSGHQRLEPSFEDTQDSPVEWGQFELSMVDGREGNRPISPKTVDEDEGDFFVIFPKVFVMEEKPKPITSGAIIWKSQLQAAAQEVRKAPPPAPFEEPVSPRHRRKMSRAMSMGSDAARGGPVEKRFSFKAKSKHV